MSDTAMASGQCTCGAVRYRLTDEPLIVHCCHCSWCQRETGSAFVLNLLIETRAIECLADEPITVRVPSESGNGQVIMRCRDCQTALWSHYPGMGEHVAFVRVGTLHDPGRFPPDIHIYTDTRHAWISLPDDVPSSPEFYKLKEIWTESSLNRYRALRCN